MSVLDKLLDAVKLNDDYDEDDFLDDDILDESDDDFLDDDEEEKPVKKFFQKFGKKKEDDYDEYDELDDEGRKNLSEIQSEICFFCFQSYSCKTGKADPYFIQ